MSPPSCADLAALHEPTLPQFSTVCLHAETTRLHPHNGDERLEFAAEDGTGSTLLDTLAPPLRRKESGKPEASPGSPSLHGRADFAPALLDSTWGGQHD